MRHAYPLMLDVTERLVVIVGGGRVAARKARGILDAAGRHVRMVAVAFHGDVPEGVQRVMALYTSHHLDGAGLVFAATDSDEVNGQVVRDARSRGVLVCRADSDEQEPGDFITPAKWSSGPLLVSVSAGSAALAAKVRDGIAQRLDPSWAEMADLMQSLRPLVLGASSLSPLQRREIFRTLASDDALAAVASGGRQALAHWLRQRHPELSLPSHWAAHE